MLGFWIIGFIVLYVIVALLFDRFDSDRPPIDRHSDVPSSRTGEGEMMLSDSVHSGLSRTAGIVDTLRNK